MSELHITRTKVVKKKLSWQGQIVVIFGMLVGVVLFPSAIFLSIAMLPTTIAFFVDRSPKKIKAITIGALNLAGATNYLIELWKVGHTPSQAIAMVTEPLNMSIIYAAALIGYMIDWAVSGMVMTVVAQRAEARLRKIEKEQKELERKWGPEVVGNIPLDHNLFPKKKEEDRGDDD